MGLEARRNGINAGTINVRQGNTTIIDGVASNGLSFRGFRDDSTNEITNFFPTVPKTN